MSCSTVKCYNRKTVEKRHFWLKAFGRDDWNDNQIKNAFAVLILHQVSKRSVSQFVVICREQFKTGI